MSALLAPQAAANLTVALNSWARAPRDEEAERRTELLDALREVYAAGFAEGFSQGWETAE